MMFKFTARMALIAAIGFVVAAMGVTREPEGSSFKLFFPEFSVTVPPVGLWENVNFPNGKGMLRVIGPAHVVVAGEGILPGNPAADRWAAAKTGPSVGTGTVGCVITTGGVCLKV